MKYYKFVPNKKNIDELRKKKRNNEQNLAIKLEEQFGQYPLKNIIQAISKAAIKDLLAHADENELNDWLNGLDRRNWRFWKEERQEQRGMSRYGNERLRQLKIISATPIKIIEPSDVRWDPGDCADIMRMYGEFIEKVGEKPESPSYYKFAAKYGKRGRRWSHYDWLIDRRKIRYEQKIKHIDTLDWDTMKSTTPEKEAKKPQGKRDARLARWERPEPMAKQPFKGKKGYVDDRGQVKGLEGLEPHDVRVREQVKKWKEAWQNANTAKGKMDLLSMIVNESMRRGDSQKKYLKYVLSDPIPGIFGWKLRPESAIYQIDRTFGLPEGADISGTTADTVFAIEALYETLVDHRAVADKPALLTDLIEIRPLISLLPIASMVSKGHHTTLECSMTLTMNDYVNYAIGYYTTLFPEAWWEISEKKYNGNMANAVNGEIFKTPKFAKRALEVWKVLKEHEEKYVGTNEKNLPLLLCHNHGPKAPASSVLLIEEKDKPLFKRLCAIRDNLMTWMAAAYVKDFKERYIDIIVIAHTFLYYGRVFEKRIGIDGTDAMFLTIDSEVAKEYRKSNLDKKAALILDFIQNLGQPEEKMTDKRFADVASQVIKRSKEKPPKVW